MRHALLVVAVSLLIAGCAAKGAAGEAGDETKLLAADAGSVSFAPGGQMYVFTHGMHLAVRRAGDGRTFLLTKSPPAKAGEGGEEKEKEEVEEEAAPEKECVPADPGSALPGPQGGWHGHAAWSPDGRFIAFMAPWEDGNCVEGDDGDWDIWLVNVDGLDLDEWVQEVTPNKEEPDRKDSYIVGPGGTGLTYHQVSSVGGSEQRPTWADCRTLAYGTESGVRVADLTHIPGICEKTIAEVAAEREARIENLESTVKDLKKQVSELGAKVTAMQQPPATEQ